ncbi:hypothetical protein L596_023361 [Steinernema carpocapsae]|uniref:Uncharacterized protein n=1 Tax=Steinernema carpocapsae TaxID=34508 RepID=A0A4U5MDG0_STECR|nr:hypothetical protein L596_023361 [Steinernema carpocapsae]
MFEHGVETFGKHGKNKGLCAMLWLKDARIWVFPKFSSTVICGPRASYGKRTRMVHSPTTNEVAGFTFVQVELAFYVFEKNWIFYKRLTK